SSCDEINLDGTPKPHTQSRSSYSHAQKMRASATYAFGRIHGLGILPWHQNDAGRMVGNPSVSTTVSSFMLSLHRRKIRLGETSTCARAITPDIMEKLYEFNGRPENWDPKPYVPGTRTADRANWGGPNTR
ncbi:hypothetical protein PLICRDRAFT_77947, partial [Plicaturopsis crispa FD-325 SS-3]